MKKVILKVVAKLAEKNVKKSTTTACIGFSYQPKVPANIKNFKK